MQPIQKNLSLFKTHPTHSANSTFNGPNADFSKQLQSVLQQNQNATQTTSGGGMNGAAHRLLRLAGKG